MSDKSKAKRRHKQARRQTRCRVRAQGRSRAAGLKSGVGGGAGLVAEIHDATASDLDYFLARIGTGGAPGETGGRLLPCPYCRERFAVCASLSVLAEKMCDHVVREHPESDLLRNPAVLEKYLGFALNTKTPLIQSCGTLAEWAAEIAPNYFPWPKVVRGSDGKT